MWEGWDCDLMGHIAKIWKKRIKNVICNHLTYLIVNICWKFKKYQKRNINVCFWK